MVSFSPTTPPGRADASGAFEDKIVQSRRLSPTPKCPLGRRDLQPRGRVVKLGSLVPGGNRVRAHRRARRRRDMGPRGRRRSHLAPECLVVTTEPRITAFVCANCRRPALGPSSGLRPARLPVLPWPAPAEEVAVPCTGRLQPEHLLKAFEAGADLVCVVACRQDNCHHLEGSRRAARRSALVQGLLDEIGSSRDRLMLLYLPGSARQDLAAGRPGAIPADAADGATELAAALSGLAEQVAARLRALPPNPMHHPPQAPVGADQAGAGPGPEDQDHED